MPGNESKRAESEEEDAWSFKKRDQKANAQFKAGSLSRPIRRLPAKKNDTPSPATVTASTSTKGEQHADTTTSEEFAALARAYEEQQAQEDVLSYQVAPVEDEESDRASSREEEQSPTVEDFEAKFDDVPVMAAGPSLDDELGADYDGYSDNGEILEAGDDLADDAGNDFDVSTSTGAGHSMEAGVLEMRRECDGLKKEVESRDKRIAALTNEMKSHADKATALETDLDSRDKRMATLAKELDSKGEKLTKVEKDLESCERQLTALGKDLESRDQRVATLEKSLESRNQTAAALEEDLDSRDKQIATLTEKLDSRDKELAALGNEVESHGKRAATIKKDLASRDEEIAALKKQLEARNNDIAALEEELESHRKELESRAERIAGLKKELESRHGELAILRKNLEQRDKQISGMEAQKSQLTNGTTKTGSTRNVATNTEAFPEDAVSRPDTPREDENGQRLMAAKLKQPSTASASLGMKAAELVRFLQMCLDMLKTFYLAFIAWAGTASMRARSFLSSVGTSGSFQRAVDVGQKWMRASAVYLATPFWIIMSFAMFMSIWRERSYWVQANAVTRRHLLKHATGVSEVTDWDWFFAFGSAAMW